MTKTVGKIALDLQQETPQKLKLREQVEAMQADYMKYLLDTVDRGYKKYTTDFFIEVQTKNEKLLHNVFRNYFIDRLSCPTPNYDQSVFRYNREKGQVEYLWTIPSRDTAHHLKDNALEVSSQPSEKGLLEFVLKFDSGELFKMMKQYNNEKLETPELIN